jgi:PPOX class probable F420-dependent enzyme
MRSGPPLREAGDSPEKEDTVDTKGLGRERYVSLTTFKRDGTPVSTPVWIAAEDGHLLVWSAAATWKVKRIRRDPHVRLTPCNASGKPRGEAVEATATIRAETARVQKLLTRKYRLMYPLVHGFGVVSRFLRRRPEAESVTIEIVPEEDGA